MKISEAIKSDENLKDFMKKVEAGEIVFSSGPVDVIWTEEDKKKLNEVFAKAFGWNNKPTSQSYMGHTWARRLGVAQCICEGTEGNTSIRPFPQVSDIDCPFHGR